MVSKNEFLKAQKSTGLAQSPLLALAICELQGDLKHRSPTGRRPLLETYATEAKGECCILPPPSLAVRLCEPLAFTCEWGVITTWLTRVERGFGKMMLEAGFLKASKLVTGIISWERELAVQGCWISMLLHDDAPWISAVLSEEETAVNTCFVSSCVPSGRKESNLVPTPAFQQTY